MLFNKLYSKNKKNIYYLTVKSKKKEKKKEDVQS